MAAHASSRRPADRLRRRRAWSPPAASLTLLLAPLVAASATGTELTTRADAPTSQAAPLVLDRDLVLTDDIETASKLGRPAEEVARLVRSGEHAAPPDATITVDYPLDESIFPPEIVAPEFLWHDSQERADTWLLVFALADRPHRIHLLTAGGRPEPEIDPQCLGPTNEVYRGTDYQRQAKGCTPTSAVWELVKRHSVEQAATVTVVGFNRADPTRPLSRGQVRLATSKDPVGASLFYRDVPLMPTTTEEGVISPIVANALPLIAWRIRDLSQPQSRVVLRDMPTCANCHSFSLDGKTLGMDIDGPRGDRGAYAVAEVRERMVIDHEQIMTWNSYPDKPKGHSTIGFMSQVSPTGRYVVSTVNEAVFVANFRDYCLLQVFYPTRGILAVYDRRTGRIEPLPGADDPAYVHCSPCWSPDGKSLVFCRAPACEPYGEGPLPEKANDPAETKVRYDLYRIPFHEGRGGKAEPLFGASHNGKSNSFPKYSPDGRWIVYVQARNGLLMRPDSRLYIIPATGGPARELRCNTARMNSWHTWSPNSRWLGFSSKANTPYTEFFLTHIDEQGNDSPAILVPHCTAANRAVNIPEFVNRTQPTIESIEVPAVTFARHLKKGEQLLEADRLDEALAEFRSAIALQSDYSPAYRGIANVLRRQGKTAEAIEHYAEAIRRRPKDASSRNNLAWILATHPDERYRNPPEAVRLARQACQLTRSKDPAMLDTLAVAYAAAGDFRQAIETLDKAIHMLEVTDQAPLADELRRRRELFEAGRPYREK